MGYFIKTYCSCDDNCDEPCLAHARENELQDQRAELREALLEILNTTTDMCSVTPQRILLKQLIKIRTIAKKAMRFQ